MGKTWEELEQACLNCQRCALADTRHHVVFGVGPRNAEIMCIGEGPGEQEDLQGVKRLHRQHRQVPPASEPGPAEHRAGHLNRLPPRPGGPDPAQNHRVPGTHCRLPAHP